VVISRPASIDCTSLLSRGSKLLNVRTLETLDVTAWEQDRPTYRADVWTQRRVPSGSDQEKIGWKLEAYEITDVEDVREAIDWLEAKARKAGERDEVNATASTLYAVGPQSMTGPGLMQLFGINPTRGDM
jgi:hypothetical protein